MISKEMKKLQGTYEASRDIDTLSLPEWDGKKMPAAPDGWPYPIKSLWNERCHDLNKSGYLSPAFLALLRRYCFAVYQAQEAETKWIEEGMDSKSKWLIVLENATKTMERIGAKFGFTPLDANKIPAKVKDEFSNPLIKIA